MVQTSSFWEGTTGDASVSPYSAAEWAEALYAIYGMSFVITGYGNHLNIDTVSKEIKSGAALVFGYVYTSDADWGAAGGFGVPFDAQGGGEDRIDRVVLRVDTAAQTVRMTVIKGVAGVTPAVPALTANDMSLYYVYLRDGFAGGAQDTEFWQDERVFGQFSLDPLRYDYTNHMPNSELLAFSELALGTNVPDRWSGTVTSAVAGAAVAPMVRGRMVRYGLQAGNTLQCLFSPLYDDDEVHSSDNTFTLKGNIYLRSGNIKITITVTDATGATSSVTRRFLRIGEYTFVMRNVLSSVYTEFTTSYTITITRYDADADVDVGQLLFVRGYVPGPCRQRHEYIPFNNELYDATWTANVPGPGVWNIDLGATFSNVVQRSVRNIQIISLIADAASAGKDSLHAIYGRYYETAPVDLSFIPNNTVRNINGTVMVYWDGTRHKIVVQTNSNTSVFSIGIVGMYT